MLHDLLIIAATALVVSGVGLAVGVVLILWVWERDADRVRRLS